MTATTLVTKSLKAIGISLALLMLAGCGDLICGSGSHMAWTGNSFDCVDDR